MKKHNIKRITEFLEKFDWMFETNNFERHITIIEKQPEEHPSLTAEVVPDMTYREITIKLYPYFWELTLDLQRKALLHELVHTTLQQTKLLAIDALDGVLHTDKEIKNENEKATSKITHLLDCLLLGSLNYARRAYRDYAKPKKTKR